MRLWGATPVVADADKTFQKDPVTMIKSPAQEAQDEIVHFT